MHLVTEMMALAALEFECALVARARDSVSSLAFTIEWHSIFYFRFLKRSFFLFEAYAS